MGVVIVVVISGLSRFTDLSVYVCTLCLFCILFSAESGFASSLYDWSRNVVHEFVVLSRHCLEGGQPALETMLQERLVGTFVLRVEYHLLSV